MKTERTKQGFTLIELLVVIAIIAILAAILFPVFASAREKARQTMCLSNEKQMGVAFMQYVQDYDETFPLGQYTGVDGVQWMASINPYVKNGTALKDQNGVIFAMTDGVYQCPDYPNPEQGSTYGVNTSILTVSSPPTLHGWPSAALAQIQSSSDTVLVAELGVNDGTGTYNTFDPEEDYWASSMGTAAGNYLNYTHYDLTGSPANGTQADCDATAAQIAANNFTYGSCGMMPRYRHSGTSNFIFCDGHAKAVPRGQLSWYRNIYVQGQYEQQEWFFAPPY